MSIHLALERRNETECIRARACRLDVLHFSDGKERVNTREQLLHSLERTRRRYSFFFPQRTREVRLSDENEIAETTAMDGG